MRGEEANMSSEGDRHEPWLLVDLSSGPVRAESLTFMQDAKARAQSAGILLWLSAGASFAALLALSLTFVLPGHTSPAFMVGKAIGAILWPLLAVGISALWNHRRSQRSLLKVFLIACLVLSAATLLSTLTRRGYWQHAFNKTPKGAQEFLDQASRCARARDLVCEEESWRGYVALRPTEALGAANLGIVLNRMDKHTEAAEQFKRALALGEGAYDLFAYYADSLAKLGQNDQAIEWSYKALSVVPGLVDVRSKLAKLLVGANRPYEALALLQAYDSQMEARGRPAYFSGQRIAIETTIEQDTSAAGAERLALRVPSYAGHYFAPVTIGRSKPTAFMVDTGATRTTVSEAFLKASGVDYRVTQPDVQMITADGRKVMARAITIESMTIGRFKLNKVLALTCQDCMPLLGQSTLSGFDMQSSKVGGVESLVLVQRNR